MDLSRGYGEHLKLLHLNASTSEKRERIQAFSRVILEAEPLDKSLSMFAYYPDYLLEITPWEGGKLTVIVDINGEYVDFYYQMCIRDSRELFLPLPLPTVYRLFPREICTAARSPFPWIQWAV